MRRLLKEGLGVAGLHLKGRFIDIDVDIYVDRGLHVTLGGEGGAGRVGRGGQKE